MHQPSLCPVCVSGGPNWWRLLWYGDLERKTLIGLTSLITRNPPMLLKLKRKRALFVPTRFDEILAWEKQKEAARIRGL